MSCQALVGNYTGINVTGCSLPPVRTLTLHQDVFACWWRPCGVTWNDSSGIKAAVNPCL